jgi:hypothetical protein
VKKPAAKKTLVVYLAAREVPRRFMGTRVEPKCEAELRELVSGTYVARARVTRPTKDRAIEAARALATRRGWTVGDRRVTWTTSSEAYERAIDEDTRDLRSNGGHSAAQDEAVSAYLAATGYARGKPYKLPGPPPKPPLLFTEFVSEMHEVVREARQTGATDKAGRDVALYYGDMLHRLEDAVDLVNERLRTRR